MSQSEIAEIIYDAAEYLGTPRYIADTMPAEAIAEAGQPRLVIIVGQTRPARYWANCYVKVNFCVPDIQSATDKADALKLKDAELALRPLHNGTGNKDGETYRYSLETTEIVSDTDMRCHYVNITLLFQYQNINKL